MRNPVFEMIEDDTKRINAQRKKDKKGRLPEMKDKLNDYEPEYVVCCVINNMDFRKADRDYKNMDVLELYNKYAYKIAIEYDG